MEQIKNLVSWCWGESHNNINELYVFVVTLSVLILATIWCKSRLSNSSNGAPSLPPGPYSLPIVGYIPFLSPNLHTQFTNMAHTYGPIFKLKLGSKLYVVINTPELAKEVVRDQDEVFSNRDQQAAAFVLSNGGQDIAFSDNNGSWRKLRKILVHETLSNKNLEASSSFRRDEVRKTVKNVFGKIGTQVGIFEIALSTVTNVLMRTIWENASYSGVKNENLAAEINVAAYNIITILGRMNLSDFFPSLARFDIQGVVHDMKKQCNRLDQLLTNIIEDRIESNLNKSQNKAGHEGKKDFFVVKQRPNSSN